MLSNAGLQIPVANAAASDPLITSGTPQFGPNSTFPSDVGFSALLQMLSAQITAAAQIASPPARIADTGQSAEHSGVAPASFASSASKVPNVASNITKIAPQMVSIGRDLTSPAANGAGSASDLTQAGTVANSAEAAQQPATENMSLPLQGVITSPPVVEASGESAKPEVHGMKPEADLFELGADMVKPVTSASKPIQPRAMSIAPSVQNPPNSATIENVESRDAESDIHAPTSSANPLSNEFDATPSSPAPVIAPTNKIPSYSSRPLAILAKDRTASVNESAIAGTSVPTVTGSEEITQATTNEKGPSSNSPIQTKSSGSTPHIDGQKMKPKDKTTGAPALVEQWQPQAPSPQQPLTLLAAFGLRQTNALPTTVSAQLQPTQPADTETKTVEAKRAATTPGNKLGPVQKASYEAPANTPSPLPATVAASQSAPEPASSTDAGAATIAPPERPALHSDSQMADPSSVKDPVSAKDNPRAPTMPTGNLAFALRVNNPDPTTNEPNPAQAVASVTRAGQNADRGLLDTFPAAKQKPASQQQHGAASDTTTPTFSAAYMDAVHPQDKQTNAAENPTAVIRTEPEPQPEVASKNTINNVHLQLTGDNNERVDVRLVDRNGELRVSVRTPDPNLAQSLQERIPELTSRLDTQRFHSEVWTPRMAESIRPETNGNSFSSSSGNGSTNSGGNFGREGNGQGQNQNQPDWLDELEPVSNSAAGTRRKQVWPQ